MMKRNKGLLLAAVALLTYVLVLQRALQHTHRTSLDDESLLSGLLSSTSNSRAEYLEQRIRVLEDKLDTFLAWGSDPFLSSQTPATCKNHTRLEEYCPNTNKLKKCHLGMPICLDNFPYNNCTVYDFGIREEPDFGVILSLPPFNCQVYAFDPSPISKKWYDSLKAKETIHVNDKYHFYTYGGGYADETITLKEYNWGQVSVYQYPTRIVNPDNCTTDGRCRYHKHTHQKSHKLPVRSVSSIRKELGHDHIDILKLDVEGSEYRILESLIDNGDCRFVDQLTLEWHHFDFDLRYGASSFPHLNVLYRMLQTECGLEQYWIHDPTGWPSNDRLYSQMQLTLRYNLVAFRRTTS